MAEAKNPWVDSDGDGDSLSLEEAAARDEKQGQISYIYMESSTVQDDLQALVQKSVCRK